MKKINLKGLSEVLSEKELKNVMGGSVDMWCFKCSNGLIGACLGGMCADTDLGDKCPGGWISWIPIIEGQFCFIE